MLTRLKLQSVDRSKLARGRESVPTVDMLSKCASSCAIFDWLKTKYDVKTLCYLHLTIYVRRGQWSLRILIGYSNSASSE